MSIAPFFFIVIALLAAGLILVRVGQRTRRETGLPGGAVLYSDTGPEEATAEPLVSQRFGLVGKPDYLVEVVSAGETLHRSHRGEKSQTTVDAFSQSRASTRNLLLARRRSIWPASSFWIPAVRGCHAVHSLYRRVAHHGVGLQPKRYVQLALRGMCRVAIRSRCVAAAVAITTSCGSGSIEDQGPQADDGCFLSGCRTNHLVVEDNSSTRIALEAILEALGYAVLMAVDAREAQAIYQAHGPEISLVMSDLMMPEISGPELFTILKEINPAVRMVIMSGYPLEDDASNWRNVASATGSANPSPCRKRQTSSQQHWPTSRAERCYRCS